MRKTPLVVGVSSLALAALIFVFADGARRIYAGIFFTMLGVVIVVNARRST